MLGVAIAIKVSFSCKDYILVSYKSLDAASRLQSLYWMADDFFPYSVIVENMRFITQAAV